MKFTALTKWSAALGVAAVAATGISAPAMADPVFTASNNDQGNFGVLAGVGSDTIQDIDNGLSAALGHTGAATTNWKMASYDATGSAWVSTSYLGDPFYRPNGSGDGANVLLTAIGYQGSATGTTYSGIKASWTTARVAGQVQFSRSSSAPSGDNLPTGVIAYVPFAKDLVGYAVDASTSLPSLTVGTSSDIADAGTHIAPSTLWSIYTCAAAKVVVGGANAGKLVDGTYSAGAGETLVAIHAYVPQSSSGTAKFWQGGSASSKFGASLGTCVKRKGIATGGHTDVDVQEHDGTVLEGDAGAIMPFSVPQWVAQGNSAAILTDTGVTVTDRRHGAVLGTINGLAATTGSTGTYAMNANLISDTGANPSTGNNKPSWLSRTMYHLVPAAKMDNHASAEYLMFGNGGLICLATSTITKFGFATLSSGCGDDTARRYAASASTLTVTPSRIHGETTDTTFQLNVSATSNGNQGGALSVKVGGAEVATGTIAANSSSTTVDVPVANIGSALTVTFTPTLLGIAQSSATAITSKYTPTIASTTAGAKVKKTGTVTVTIKQKGALPTGTITIKDGVTTVGTGTLTLASNGSVTVTIAAIATKGTKDLTVQYSGDANYAEKLDGSVSYVVK
jgi:hypothetical protein